MYNYVLAEEYFSDNDNGTYLAYGIKAYENNNIVEYIANISICKDKIEGLVKLCNHLQPHTVHLYDVVTDYIP